MFFINNDLRDVVYKNNLLHGFWDNARTYEDFVHNLLGEFDEALEELSDHLPTLVYTKDGKKPEGAPTELADIIIFILDYFGGSVPMIDIDEEYLMTPDDYYKNPEYYKIARTKKPWQYFLEVTKECRGRISMSFLYFLLHGNTPFVNEAGKTCSVGQELHFVIKRILEVCEVLEIDMEKELLAKIEYNNSRPKDYRKLGNKELLETDSARVFTEMLGAGYGMYKETDNVIQERKKINDTIIAKRNERARLEEEEREKSRRV